MSFAIVCHGCGASVPIADDYQRNKMQCPECGVMCPIPPRPPAKKKGVEPKPAEDAPRFEDDEPTASAAPTSAPPTFTEAPTPAGKGLATCPQCGEVVRVPGPKRGRPGKCPVCGGVWPAPAARAKPSPPPAAPLPPPPDEFAGSSPDEDPDTSNPYRTADPGSRRCPGCSAQLGPAVAVCVRCGFDLRQGKKVVREFQKFERSWDSGPSLRTRLMLALLCQAAALTAIVAGFLTVQDSWSGATATFSLSWLVYTAMTAFLLGTYDHVDLKRFKSGRVELVRRWRVAFVPCPPEKIDVRAYFGVSNGASAHAGFWEWLIFLILLGSGVIPAVVYWYCVIHKTEYTVSLCNEHENPEIKVYRGWSQEQMLEIQQTLRDALTV